MSQKRSVFDWSLGIESQSSAVQVAVGWDNRILGVMQADEDLQPPRDLPEIQMLYVDPAVWGSRVATQLLETGLGWIARRGHTMARLRVVESHVRARRFYEREGWQLDPDLEPAGNGFFRLIYYRRSLLDAAAHASRREERVGRLVAEHPLLVPVPEIEGVLDLAEGIAENGTGVDAT